MSVLSHCGVIARRVRENQGVTQRDMAESLGVTAVHLCNVERGKAIPSWELVDRFEVVTGVDLYVASWCMFGAIETTVPEPMRKPARALGVAFADWICPRGKDGE